VELFLSICLGIGLSAACGFRVFVPLLCLSIASKAGFVSLAPTFAWIGTTPAVVALSVATVLEIGAYYVPWLDNALDSVAVPLATVAGIVATASVVTNIDPFWRWTLAVIAGGGIATSTKLATTKARLASTVSTGGLANPVIATAESASSVALSILAVVWAPIALVLALAVFVGSLAVLYFVGKRVWKLFRRSTPTVVNQPT
jgi:hypothetical protein